VIEMAMRDPDGIECEVLRRETRPELVAFRSGIDDRGTTRGVIDQEIRIGLKRPDRNSLDAQRHSPIP
jgi:hypothetical protein